MQTNSSTESAKTNEKPKGSAVSGIILILLALGIFLWAQAHSPHMGYGEMLTKMDSYMIKEPAYTIILLICAGPGLTGFVSLVKNLSSKK